MKFILFPHLKYQVVNVYIDITGTMYLVSTGRSKKYGGVIEIDYINTPKSGYSDSELFEKVFDSFENCYSLAPPEEQGNPAIEKYIGFKTHSRAVRSQTPPSNVRIQSWLRNITLRKNKRQRVYPPYRSNNKGK